MKIYHKRYVKTVGSLWQALQPKRCDVYQGLSSRGCRLLFWRAKTINPLIRKRQHNRGFDTRYACYGATVGSYKHKNGPFTPFGDSIDIILQDEFTLITKQQLRNGDVVIWLDEDGDICHSARVSHIYRDQTGRLLDFTRLDSKNGAGMHRDKFRLSTLMNYYGRDMKFYRENVNCHLIDSRVNSPSAR